MGFKEWQRCKQVWESMSHREQRLLKGLVGLVLVIVSYTLIWQPTRHRLDLAERQYWQQAALAARIQHLEPTGATTATSSLSVRISDSATAAELELAELEIDGDSLRLAVSGDANRLLDWLDRQERDGATLQVLSLEVRNGVLDARMVLGQ
ncbi:type II secretion system protein GspM [Pseudomonas fluorescens]|uniref:type II secretion system protein GspM n=1 Tax=Pseudomonas fluorescens TaxID=294 RepID=UPI001BEB13CB|nr:type II secretion system protein GspM [Pseudomonas fluorescens]MBT2296718.1 type II secretion system protein M [Pseudomonas fluorescens]MBT2307780.1 type II secretion system protein M [Pseudomonas fluorescens]MBT2313142.1 type II secretion system protein M [Pseudomonas fluorescens]MBT2317307.1 type II secretion system protein M [Pseudomonas fluorescens]MBT2343783.1 type II secretion system protein M [Pseudomonas fluorescens]